MAVAERQSLKGASEHLNLSASAVSRRVQALEAHVGRRVFDRVNGEFRISAEGADLLEQLAPAFDSLTRAFESLHGEAGETLRLGVMPAFGSGWLLPRLSRFKASHPGAAVELDTAANPLSRLSGSIDAAILLAHRPEEGLYSRRLCQQVILAVCAPAMAEGPNPIRAPEDVLGHSILLHSRTAELLDVWLAAMGLHGARVKIDYYDSGPLLLEAAAQGLGVALVFDTMVPTLLEGKRLVSPFSENVRSPLNYWFFCRHASLNNRSVRRFRDWLLREAGLEIEG